MLINDSEFQSFRNELLYLIGFKFNPENIAFGSVCRIDKKRVSLINQTISLLSSKKEFSKLNPKTVNQFARNLCASWLLRLFFVKFLENKLNIDVFPNNETLNFEALEQVFKKLSESNNEANQKNIPSEIKAIFHIQNIEKQAFTIGALDKVLKTQNSEKNTSAEPFLAQKLIELFQTHNIQANNTKNALLAFISIIELIINDEDNEVLSYGFVVCALKKTVKEALISNYKRQNTNTKDINESEILKNEYEKLGLIVNKLKFCLPKSGSGFTLLVLTNILSEISSICEQQSQQKNENDLLFNYFNASVNDELTINELVNSIRSKNDYLRNIVALEQDEFKVLISRILFSAFVFLDTNFSISLDKTLIERNIKQGFPLLLNHSTNESLKNIFPFGEKKSDDFIASLKELKEKSDSKKYFEIADEIKRSKRKKLSREHPKIKQLYKLIQKHEIKFPKKSLFEVLNHENLNEKIKLENEIIKVKYEIDELEFSQAQRLGVEWRIDFPQVLDKNGNYEGFDVIIDLGFPNFNTLNETYKQELQKQKEEKYNDLSNAENYFSLWNDLLQEIVSSDGIFVSVLPEDALYNSNFEVCRKKILKEKYAYNISSISNSLNENGTIILNRKEKSENVYLSKENTPNSINWNLAVDYDLLNKVSKKLPFHSIFILPDELAYQFLDKVFSFDDNISSFYSVYRLRDSLQNKPFFSAEIIDCLENTYLLKGADKEQFEVEKTFFRPSLSEPMFTNEGNINYSSVIFFPFLKMGDKLLQVRKQYIQDNAPKTYEFLKTNELFLHEKQAETLKTLSKNDDIVNLSLEKLILSNKNKEHIIDKGNFIPNKRQLYFKSKTESPFSVHFLSALLGSMIFNTIQFYYESNTGNTPINLSDFSSTFALNGKCNPKYIAEIEQNQKEIENCNDNEKRNELNAANDQLFFKLYKLSKQEIELF